MVAQRRSSAIENWWHLRGLLGVVACLGTGCLQDGRPLAGYLSEMQAYQAGLAQADIAADAPVVDGAATDASLQDAALEDAMSLDAVTKDVATAPDIMRWLSDGYVKPPGDPTCAVIESSGICTDQTGLPNIAVSLQIHNTCSKRTLRLYWYDSQCKAHKYGEVGPKQWLSQQSFLGHAWRFVDSETGELIAEHLITTFPGGVVNLP